MDNNDPSPLTRRVIGCGIEVHHHLGPGLLESFYEEALARELTSTGLAFQRQARFPLLYKGQALDGTVVLDLIVEQTLVVEVKAVAQILPVHEAQLLTYLRVSRLSLGLLLNFNEARLKDGIRRRRL
jgi:GxxExxY protein